MNLIDTIKENIDLIIANKENDPKTFNAVYGLFVGTLFRLKYPQSDVEAIQNNYIAEPNNPKYIAEMNAMQDYRKECKATGKALFKID